MPADAPASTNAHEFTVSELAGALKRTVEDAYGAVRVRGELGRVVLAKSGHLYFDLKDERAVIATVMWKGQAASLPFRPEEGLEVVATGRLSTYPGRSQYQLIADSLAPAGAGALMALLEARKAKLAAEGLFAETRKRAIPYLPTVIGVVTSPTGAVIRDILHRIGERFPRRVILWPVLVQGEQAAGQIAAAIAGFNALAPGGPVPRPDVIIVARGGGSVEDLWAFNEEVVVRAAAASEIPLISAVGHETDTTLIDYASDRRAPTPTGAAEMAVPVRAELMADVARDAERLVRALSRLIDRRRTELRAAARALPRPEALLGLARQRLDSAGERLRPSLGALVARRRDRLAAVAGGLRPKALSREIADKGRRLADAAARIGHSGCQTALARRRELDALGARLETLSYRNTLQRGFAVVRHESGAIVRAGADLGSGEAVALEFADAKRAARIEGGAPPAAPKPAPKPKSKPAASTPDRRQGDLF